MANSHIKVNSIVGSDGTSPINISFGATCPSGTSFEIQGNATITGILTATSFSGSGSGLTNLSVAQVGQAIGLSYLQ